jgi:hypothetical protein
MASSGTPAAIQRCLSLTHDSGKNNREFYERVDRGLILCKITLAELSSGDPS